MTLAMLSCALVLSGCSAIDRIVGTAGSSLGAHLVEFLPTPPAETKKTLEGGDWCAIAKKVKTNTIKLSPQEIAFLQTKNLNPIVAAEMYGRENCRGWR